MTQSEFDLNRVRDFIRSIHKQLGADPTTPYQETVLLQNEHYCGRCISVGSIQAVWFAEERNLKLRNHSRHVLASYSLGEAELVADEQLIRRIQPGLAPAIQLERDVLSNEPSADRAEASDVSTNHATSALTSSGETHDSDQARVA